MARVRRERLSLSLGLATLAVAATTGCHATQPGQRPIGEGVREYLASRPAYMAAPSRTFTIGSYAGYNYGQARPVALPSEATPEMIGD
ncbi:MAG: hypothetical protein JWN86_4415 [Planctomycetota bacterium]|nr:hypothetical protein [Planctomycetota bacterium]